MNKAEYLKRNRLIELAAELLGTFDLYPHRECYTEKHLEFALCALLRRSVTKVKPQPHAKVGRSNTGRGRRDQIDFRTGTSNQVFVEFAVRRKNRNNSVTGWRANENKTELIKLSGETGAGTKARYLLIVDISREPPLTATALENSYRPVWAALPSRPRAVIVLYVHPKAVEPLRLD